MMKTTGKKKNKSAGAGAAEGFRLGKYYRRLCFVSTILNLLSVPVSLMTAELLSDVADAATGGDFQTVLHKAVTVLCIFLGVFALRTAISMWQHRESTVVGNRCRVEFLGMFLRNPAHKLFTADEGELNENLNDDLEESAKRYKKLFPSMIVAGISVVAYLTFLSLESLPTAGTMLGISLLQLLPPLVVKKFFEKYYDEGREAYAAESDHVAEAVEGFDMIKLYSLVPWWMRKLDAVFARIRKTERGASTAAAMQNVMYSAIESILRFGTYAILGLFAMKQWITMETVVKAVCLSAELFASVNTLFCTIPDFGTASRAQKRLDKWATPAAPEASDTRPAEELVFEKTGYTIDEEEIVRDLTLRLRANENYLLTGVNGAGMSTLLHLMTGVVLPTDGEVRWEDRWAAPIPVDASPSEVMLIPQQDPAFHFSALEFYEMFDKTKRDAMLGLAARFGLGKDRLASPITELSGGERKKVFLSMGFGASSRWLLLDEPTNSLDESGKQILLELIRARAGVLAVSHDTALSTAFANTLTMEGGRLQ